MAQTKLRTLARALVLLIVCATSVSWIAACGGGGGHGVKRLPNLSHPSPLQPGFHPRVPPRPNIVFVLTDDLSMNLLRFMPHVQAMERRGLTFKNYFVSDSLCCPSRSSIFTGNFPHDTHVFSNFGPGGGFHTFYARGEERHTFAVALQRAGYATALMGKYLNGYMGGQGLATDGSAAAAVAPTYVPPGWSEWDVAGYGYPEFDYALNQNGVLHRYGAQRPDYLTDVLATKGVNFIDRAAAASKPFFLELATFVPHSPYVPAPRDAKDFPGLTAPRPPSFDKLPTHAPQWLAGHPPLTARQTARINTVFRRRAQAVQAVDRMIGEIESYLTADGIAKDTYLVFSSDNGLHTGQYRLTPGKLTAFDTDIRVPLVVVGPRVPAGATTNAMAENIDLAKTFARIGGTNMRGDGRSLLPLLHGKLPSDWRTAVLIEHHGPDQSTLDPDFQQPTSGSPTTYEAMRTRGFLYVEYADGEREFYDLKRDPFELHNIAFRLSLRERAQLHRDLRALKRCHGGRACWAAMHVAPPPWL
jgi:arylsulfatase A-like enzyme